MKYNIIYFAFRISSIMLNRLEISGKFQFLKFRIRDFMLNIVKFHKS